MKIKTTIFCCDSSVFWLLQVTGTTAINGFGVFFHPLTDLTQNLQRLLREPAASIRTDIEKEISVFADAFHQFAD
ncbi:hypothetical protein SDC9_106902 [bioreactor metagenome]|uniref:Uncharacterized protein n=1 Tax=bioreactor metagenome TaxID=1076179 RepID=A0A645B3P6_9ZZZZ